MPRLKDIALNSKQITVLEIILILSTSVYPVFLDYSYTLNIFLSWEGAYRLYLGQVPYKDFGLPMGFGYWIIPALFFKLLGPYLITLVKAQAFLNIISALAFRSILRQLRVQPGVRLLVIFLYILTYTTLNIWPWYNNSVITFELIGLAFILNYIIHETLRYSKLKLFLGSFFIFLSFFTKQDAGFLALLIALCLIISHCIYERKVAPIIWFICFYIIVCLCFIVPFLPYNISYWFNYGQPPHYSRLSIYDILNDFGGKSEWLKFFISIIILIWLPKFKNVSGLIKNKSFIIFTVLTIGILFEASIFQVTSYIPGYNNIFFYSFAVAYILSSCGLSNQINFNKIMPLFLTAILLSLWWSGRIWPYANQIIAKFDPKIAAVDTNEVSIRTYMRSDPNSNAWMVSLTPNQSKWKYAPWKVFKKIRMPQQTIDGIQRLVNNPQVLTKGKNLKVLNMTELTPLAEVLHYVPESGSDIPLWYHKNVAMFEKQIKEYSQKIDSNYYDIALFEYIPILNNFYPFEIRDSLQKHYQLIDSFPAPRDVYYKIIEVYTKKQNQ